MKRIGFGLDRRQWNTVSMKTYEAERKLAEQL